MCLSTYVSLKTFLIDFISNCELVNLTIGADALVITYRSSEDVKESLPHEIEYNNEHYKRSMVAEMKVKTEQGYDSTGVYTATYLYHPPMVPIPSKHKYILNVAQATYFSHECARNAKAHAEEKKSKEENHVSH